jgi:hypothetical protein
MIAMREFPNFPLAFRRDRSESSCADHPPKGKPPRMTNAEATKTTETAAVAEQGAQVAPERATSKKTASQKKGAPKANKVAKKAAKQGKVAPKKQAKGKAAGKKAPKVKEAAVPARVLEKEHRPGPPAPPKGLAMAEIAKATDWQNHSTRDFIGGNLTNEDGLSHLGGASDGSPGPWEDGTKTNLRDYGTLP